MKTFEVRRAAFIRDEDLNIEYLVLAQGPEGEGARLEISRAIAYDDQDRALGQDTYSLSDETGATNYGGVDRWRFNDSTLVITLEPKAAEVMGVDSGYELSLDLSHQEESTVRDVLGKLLRQPV